MGISFNEIGNIRTPGAFSEFRADRATSNLGLTRQRLIIGQRLSIGTVAEGVVIEVSSLDLAKDAAGVGSHFADMVEKLLENDTSLRLRGILLDDNGAGVANVKTIIVTGTATTAATLSIYIAGQVVQVAVTSGDTANDIAANIEAALTSDPDILYTASVTTNVVTITAKHKGEWTQKLPVSINPFPPTKGGNEALPGGVTFAVANTVTGSGNPDISTALSVIPDEVVNYVLMPYNDDPNLDKLDTELASRNTALKQNEGHGWNAFAGTLSDATTFGGFRNSQHNTTMHSGNGSLSPEHHWAAAYFAIFTSIAAIDPARPVHFRKLIGILAEPEENILLREERDILLNNGVATHRVDPNGDVIIGREITNYQRNTGGQPDTSFLDSQTSLTLSDLRQTWLQLMISKYLSQGFKLVKDGGNIAPGQKIVSPSILRGEAISLCQEWIDIGLVEPGAKAKFKELLIVQINDTDVNRVDIEQSPDLVNQLRIIANLIRFIL